MQSQRAGVVRGATFAVVVALTSFVVLSASAAPIIPVIGAPVIVDPSSAGALSIEAVSCVSTGNCTAVGSLANPTTSTYAPVALSETAGTWGEPVAITLPVGAFATASFNDLTAIQCFSTGNCEAVGRFANSLNGTTTAIATSEINGVWGSAISVGQPADGASQPSAWLTSLACSSVGSCSAVGTYFNSQNQVETMVVTQVGGNWGTPSTLQVTSGYTSVQGPWYISCATTCVAAGPIGNGSINEAGIASESGGTWTSASPVSTTLNTAIYAISCTVVGCVAVGDETSLQKIVPALFIEKTGTWSVQTVQGSPANSSDALLTAVVCTSWGNCDAVGDVSTGTGVFALAEESGAWLPALSIPVNDSSAPIVEATGLSCTAALNCTAVGNVGSKNDVNAVAWTSHAPIVKRVIVCTHGHQIRRVSGTAPRCPSGYRQSR